MKNDHELLEEALRHALSSGGANPARVELMLHEFRTQVSPRLPRRPPVPMSDEEYAAKLEQLKKQAPAFLESLKSNQFPSLPGPDNN